MRQDLFDWQGLKTLYSGKGTRWLHSKKYPEGNYATSYQNVQHRTRATQETMMFMQAILQPGTKPSFVELAIRLLCVLVSNSPDLQQVIRETKLVIKSPYFVGNLKYLLSEMEEHMQDISDTFSNKEIDYIPEFPQDYNWDLDEQNAQQLEYDALEELE